MKEEEGTGTIHQIVYEYFSVSERKNKPFSVAHWRQDQSTKKSTI